MRKTWEAMRGAGLALQTLQASTIKSSPPKEETDEGKLPADIFKNNIADNRDKQPAANSLFV